MNNIKPGDYGHFHFTLTCKGMTTGFDLYATVIELDGKRTLLRDNDGLEYLPRRIDIDLFEREMKIPCEN
jgi:hypothetical protein